MTQNSSWCGWKFNFSHIDHFFLVVAIDHQIQQRLFFSKLEQVLEKVAEKDILFVGDFNAKHKDWFIGDNTNCNGQTLKDLMDRFDMTQ